MGGGIRTACVLVGEALDDDYFVGAGYADAFDVILRCQRGRAGGEIGR